MSNPESHNQTLPYCKRLYFWEICIIYIIICITDIILVIGKKKYNNTYVRRWYSLVVVWLIDNLFCLIEYLSVNYDGNYWIESVWIESNTSLHKTQNFDVFQCEWNRVESVWNESNKLLTFELFWCSCCRFVCKNKIQKITGYVVWLNVQHNASHYMRVNG